MKKRAYKTPSIRTEKVAIGVFGSYCDDDKRYDWSPVKVLNPFFRLCCS